MKRNMELSKEEQEAIDLFKEVLDERSCLISDDIGENDIKVVLNLIQKQSKVIDEIIQCALLNKPFSTFVCKDVSVNDCNKYRENGGCNECIKQYFYRKVEE